MTNFIFVIGFPKSGTQWLVDILNAHPQCLALPIFPVGTVFSDSREMHLYDQLGSRESTVKALRNIYGNYFFIALALSRIIPHKLNRHVVKFLYRFFLRTLSKRCSKVIVEKTADYSNFTDDILTDFPSAKFILIERKYDDRVDSYRRQLQRKSIDPSAVEKLIKKFEKGFEAEAVTTSKLRSLKNVLVLRYESFNDSCELIKSAQEMFEFCGLSSDPILVRRVIANSEMKALIQFKNVKSHYHNLACKESHGV